MSAKAHLLARWLDGGWEVWHAVSGMGLFAWLALAFVFFKVITESIIGWRIAEDCTARNIVAPSGVFP